MAAATVYAAPDGRHLRGESETRRLNFLSGAGRKSPAMKLASDLYRLSSGGFAAVHLVTAEEPILIDAGAPGRGPAIERELAAMGMRPRLIVLTHGDPDHAGASNHLRRALDAEVCAAADERAMIDRSAWAQLPRVRRLLMRFLYRGMPPPTVDRWLSDDENLGGLRVIATPGHTPGHICLEWHGWLMAGDAFRSGARFRETTWPFTIDKVESRRSIERLTERRFVGASSSHGSPSEGATAKLQALVATWR